MCRVCVCVRLYDVHMECVREEKKIWNFHSQLVHNVQRCWRAARINSHFIFLLIFFVLYLLSIHIFILYNRRDAYSLAGTHTYAILSSDTVRRFNKISWNTVHRCHTLIRPFAHFFLALFIESNFGVCVWRNHRWFFDELHGCWCWCQCPVYVALFSKKPKCI